MLGISIDGDAMGGFCGGTVRDVVGLAKALLPVLLLYAPGRERGRAVRAAWGLFGCGDGEEEVVGGDVRDVMRRGRRQQRVLVRWVSADVVPLVDYWPGEVREGFLGGVWGFVGGGGGGGSGGGGSGGGVLLEIEEFSLGVMEWLMRMEKVWEEEEEEVEVKVKGGKGGKGDGDGDGEGGEVRRVRGLLGGLRV